MSWVAFAAVVSTAVAWRLHLGLAVASEPAWLADVRERRAARAVATGLPILCEHVARSLRSGLSLRSALTSAPVTILGAVLADDLRLVAQRLDRGDALDDALAWWAARRSRSPGVSLTVAALGIAAEAGGPMAVAVDGVADTLRVDVALMAEVRAMSAQAEASAALIAVLPVGFALIAGIADPTTVAFFVTEPVGIACLVSGIALDVVGFVWMRRIAGSVV